MRATWLQEMPGSAASRRISSSSAEVCASAGAGFAVASTTGSSAQLDWGFAGVRLERLRF
jgi:hypothetical protein